MIYAYCVNCDYKSEKREILADIIELVVSDKGKLDGTYSECPKCKKQNTLAIELLHKE